jgi:cytochrome c556
VLKRFATMAGVFAVVGLVGLAGADEAKPTIKQAMTRIAKGKNAAIPTLKSALAAPSPDWKEIQANAKTVETCTEAIVDAKPRKGEQANYAKLAKAFAAHAKALHESAEKEDLAGAKAAFGKIGGSCMACHNAHKGK